MGRNHDRTGRRSTPIVQRTGQLHRTNSTSTTHSSTVRRTSHASSSDRPRGRSSYEEGQRNQGLSRLSPLSPSPQIAWVETSQVDAQTRYFFKLTSGQTRPNLLFAPRPLADESGRRSIGEAATDHADDSSAAPEFVRTVQPLRCHTEHRRAAL